MEKGGREEGKGMGREKKGKGRAWRGLSPLVFESLCCHWS